MHFDGVAARWLQSVQRELRFGNWEQFCRLLLERFGKDQHELLIRQFYHMRQTGSVSDYIQQFSELTDQLAAYESDTDKLHYTTRFIDGLRDEIKAVVMLHRPADLDTACSLALLQEEAAGSSHRRDFRKFSSGFQTKLPDVSKTDRFIPDEKRRVEPSKRSTEHDKLAALRAYRRAKEVYELFQLDSVSEEVQEIPSEVEEQAFLTLSEAAVSGSEPPKTLHLWGTIQSIAILILIDSGSSSTFLSQKVAAKLSGVSPLAKPLSDMIIGMDWLEQFSPMKVHWALKWLQIPVGGQTIQLQGLVPESQLFPEGTIVQVFHMEPDSSVVIQKSLSPDQPALMHPLLQEFAYVFEVPTEYTPAMKNEIEKQVKEMLDSGVIQPSVSAFCSPVLLVKKKDNSWRFCVDYRHLNALTVKTKYPVPVIDEFLDELGQASWFSSLDLRAGYHQVLLKPGEEFKTAFQTHSGHYEFRVMAFGLSGAPATFQCAMNTTLQPLLRKCVLVFFDDILNSISYLGHVISQGGVATDPAKIEAIMSWPTPTNIKDLRSFLGLAGYYRKFVKHFGIISRPLFDLLKKHALFIWTNDHDVAFQTLKQALCSAPVLTLPDFSKKFCLETDASGSGVGAVLLQEGHPIAFISKALSLKNQVWQQKVFTKLLGLQYQIVYKKVLASYSNDADAQSKLAQLAIDPLAVPHFSLHNGLLKYKTRIWWGGHSGVPVTLRKLKQLFAWKGLNASVHSFVTSCLVCQQAKPDRSKSPGLLQPVDVPPSAWHTISMDFVEVVAKQFLNHVYKLHGLPAVIISDRDKVFTSNFWKELFQLAGVALHISTAYHPQSDGQTERVNQCLETYLRCFVHTCPKKWSDWLATTEFWYNSSMHSALGTSPFEALYGHSPRFFGLEPDHPETMRSWPDWLQERAVMTAVVKQHLHRAKHRMKKQADKGLAYTLKLPEHCGIHPTFHVSQLKKVVGNHQVISPTLPDAFSGLQVPDKVLQSQFSAAGKQVLIKWSHLPVELATWENLVPLKQRARAAGSTGDHGPSSTSNGPASKEAQPTGVRFRVGQPVTAYCYLMSQLACMAEDVALLQDAGVVLEHYFLGSDDQAARGFADLCNGVALDINNIRRNYLIPIWHQLDRRCRMPVYGFIRQYRVQCHELFGV
ncbi:hypothetical protein U9M48_000465 [Paspalum notatum var. saurae]|uniref:Integrase catalytic domain-containing protein n=1 Tax=Paspalum notatum var. saurae TaxID=547442 RepID=A0AAQ3PMG3_PASNO